MQLIMRPASSIQYLLYQATCVFNSRLKLLKKKRSWYVYVCDIIATYVQQESLAGMVEVSHIEHF